MNRLSDRESGGGVPLSGSGHSAEPEPISVVSADAASVPNAAHVDCECAECRPYSGWTQDQLRASIEENKRRVAGLRAGVWYPSSMPAPTGYELLATDGEAVQASLRLPDGGWRAVGRQSFLWSPPTAWMMLPDAPEHCEGCDQLIPYHAHPCPALKAGLASAIETQSATTAGRGPEDESAVPKGDAR